MADVIITCPKCESKHWMTGLPLVDTYTFVKPATWNEGQKGLSTFTANICGDCGYTEFQATRFKAVWEEWRKHNT